VGAASSPAQAAARNVEPAIMKVSMAIRTGLIKETLANHDLRAVPIKN
jgi:hypothetical protein